MGFAIAVRGFGVYRVEVFAVSARVGGSRKVSGSEEVVAARCENKGR